MQKTELPHEAHPVSGSIVNPALPQGRIASVDIYRGFVMLLMMAEVLSLSDVSKALPGNKFWEFRMQKHVIFGMGTIIRLAEGHFIEG